MEQRVHIGDVAKRAGVSVGTVSNVLNRRKSVAPEYIEKVRKAVDELGFVRNDIARQLKSGGSRTISLLVLSNYNSFFTALADAAEDEAHELGYAVVLAGSAQKPEREAKYLELFEEQRSRGILIAPIDGVNSVLDGIHDRGMPVILLGETGPAERYCCVAVDGEMSGYIAAHHLLEAGRRRVAIVGGPYFQVRERVEGARRAVAEFPNASEQYLPTSDLTIDEGRRIGAELVTQSPDARPDAIFAANDLVAIGLLETLVHGGVAVPRDIAIVGSDDIQFASSTVVPLTSVRQPVEEMAAAAVRLCVQESEEGVHHVHQQLVFPPELIVRDSSAPR